MGVGLAARKAETHTMPGVGGEPRQPPALWLWAEYFFFFFCPLTNISRPGCTSKSGNLKKTQALVTQVVESPCNAGDLNSIPGSGRSAGEVNGNPLQYSCLENSMIEEPWGCKKSDTTERLTHEPEDVGSRLTIHPERWL